MNIKSGDVVIYEGERFLVLSPTVGRKNVYVIFAKDRYRVGEFLTCKLIPVKRITKVYADTRD